MDLARIAKSGAKLTAANLLYWTGALSLLVRRRLKDGAIVLMYHRVLPADVANRSFSHPGLIVTPETFTRHMDFVKQNFTPLTLAEFLQHMDSGVPFPERACLITFDDGWIDNHDYALPILRKRGIPAVIFVATDYIEGDRPFWQEYLGHLLYETARRGLGEDARRTHQIDLPVTDDDSHLRKAVAVTVDRFRAESYDSIEHLIQVLRQALVNFAPREALQPPDRFMNWEQVRSLAQSGITIASHTQSHRLLPRLEASVVSKELTDSRRILADEVGRDVPAFAYPGGYHDDTVREAAIACGYRLAFTTDASIASTTGDRWLIPRVNVHESATRTIPLFLSRIASCFDNMFG